jgi:alkyl hydroperoxide reductase subunit AhpC
MTRDAQVLSISCDSIYCHGAWAEKLGGITFPMLSDWHPKGEVSMRYGVYNDERGTPIRSIFVVDGDGVVRWKRIYPPGEGLPDVSEILGQIDALRR